MTYRGFLAELLVAECDHQARRRAERRRKAAGFLREKSLLAFDFDANPNIDPATIHTLASCEWIKKSRPLCLIGDFRHRQVPYAHRTGLEAAMKGYLVRYTLATKLVNELVEAADEEQLNKIIARYRRVDLLCIDELGYMGLDRHGAELLFQVLTEREEKNSVAIASTESFGKAHMFRRTRARCCRSSRVRGGGRRRQHLLRHQLSVDFDSVLACDEPCAIAAQGAKGRRVVTFGVRDYGPCAGSHGFVEEDSESGGTDSASAI
ncbi:ATP-binding protein [Streptomyces sp. NPDC127190]|uniref:ATP-binding protein n=1 Tax=unclassified Streptomyces TaxID=2593676 RepID=UPI00363421D2